MSLLAGYTHFILQDFGSFFRTEFDLVEDVFRLVLHEYYSIFDASEKPPVLILFRIQLRFFLKNINLKKEPTVRNLSSMMILT